jgi:RNA polymerase sigma-70 factor (ECF subfamily)
MSDESSGRIRETVESIYRAESRRVLATLIRLLGDFDVAEEAMHDAFRTALEQWPRDGLPDNPRAWLVSTGRFRAIDGLRCRARLASMEDVPDLIDTLADDSAAFELESVEDDGLALALVRLKPEREFLVVARSYGFAACKFVPPGRGTNPDYW